MLGPNGASSSSAAISCGADSPDHFFRQGPSVQRTNSTMKCRECGRAAVAPRSALPDEFYPLVCGDAFCRGCLANLARASLLAHGLIPLRCCQRRVPMEWIEAVLEPPEAGYYGFLVAKVGVSQMRATLATANQPVGRLVGASASPLLHTARAATAVREMRCESCSQPVVRRTGSEYEVLECGHAYCSECLTAHSLDALELDFAPSLPPCCVLQIQSMREEKYESLQALLADSKKAAIARTQYSCGQTNPSMIIIDDDDQNQPMPSNQAAKGPSRRTSKRTLGSRAKAARMAVNGDENGEVEGEIDLVNASALVVVDDLSAAAVVTAAPIAEEEKSQHCVGCGRTVAVTTDAPCGHNYCLKCIGDRCRRAVRNDKDGGIGLPLRCCDVLLPLATVRPALSKQAFEQYKALVIKREGDLKQLSKRKRGTGKQKVSAATTAKRARLNLVTAVATSSSAGSTEQSDPSGELVAVQRELVECIACLGQIDADAQRQFHGPCGHVYCAECLGLMARKSLEDRALVPVRCCGKEMPVEYLASVLPKRMLSTYNRFVREMDWKTSNLQSDKEYAKLVKNVGGKQCPKCGIGVQKVAGCNTMSCSHGHRFCWVCASDPCACSFRTEHARHSLLRQRHAGVRAAVCDGDEEEKRELDVVVGLCDDNDDDGDGGRSDIHPKEEQDGGNDRGADLSPEKRALKGEDGETKNGDTGPPLWSCFCCNAVLVAGNTFVLPCSHRYCSLCIVILTRISLGADVPTRCCETAIPAELLEAAHSQQEYAVYSETVGETTAGKDNVGELRLLLLARRGVWTPVAQSAAVRTPILCAVHHDSLAFGAARPQPVARALLSQGIPDRLREAGARHARVCALRAVRGREALDDARPRFRPRLRASRQAEWLHAVSRLRCRRAQDLWLQPRALSSRTRILLRLWQTEMKLLSQTPRPFEIDVIEEQDEDAFERSLCDVYALEAQREELRRTEQIRLDEAIALSLNDAEVAKLLRRQTSGDYDSDADSDADMADLECKPAPSCTCCLAELADERLHRALPCGHLYCLQCVTTRAGMGVRDRGLLPAHCCRKEFPVEYVKEALTPADFEQYMRRSTGRRWISTQTANTRVQRSAMAACSVQVAGWAFSGSRAATACVATTATSSVSTAGSSGRRVRADTHEERTDGRRGEQSSSRVSGELSVVSVSP
ncbi:hypothetical protein PybrP1_011313 [[Pythium] brassicae (nom. inval.)]|nr:hypothetical protein PybrP1_011313 [[Pythium] brassicae (nom. inval.)]